MQISIVIPVYNESEGIDELYRRTMTAISSFSDSFELICVDDGSEDTSLSQLIDYHKQDPRFKVISLSRNFGHQSAVLAGLSVAKGDYIGIMDGDLQDPPEIFERFYHKMKEGFDVVYAVRKKRKEGLVKKFAYWLYYRLLAKMSDTNIPLDSGDFCMMSRRVLDKMLTMQEQSLYLRGIRAWVGYPQAGLEYERAERFAGEPKYDFKQLFRLAYNGMFSFSSLPVRVMRRLGYFTLIFSFLYFLKILISYFLYNDAPQGFTTLALAIFFFSGVQLISIGVLGEYVYRTYNESRERPLFIIKDKYLNE